MTSLASDRGAQRADNGYTYGSFPTAERASEESSQPKPAPIRTRALGPDLLRGLLMAVMAMDHHALAINSWEHGTGRITENDGFIVERWNRPAAYTVRTLTHLCGSGFTLLLGMGIVYLGRSRSRLGWSSWRLAKYFAVRCLVLSAVTVVLGLALTGGRVWFMNAVLFALAIDYFLAGMLWLAINQTEGLLARTIDNVLQERSEEDGDEEEEGVAQPLLNDGRSIPGSDSPSARASAISWHTHNAILVILSVVTIWWNIWFSESQGHCEPHDAMVPTILEGSDPNAPVAREYKYPLLALWLWPVMTKHIMSGFPPLAWISFAILGLVYGRILTVKSWKPRAIALGHLCAGLLFLIVFVLTRVLRIGNLSEDCLKTPEEEHYTGSNQYLASPEAFFYLIKYPPDVAFWAFTLFGNFTLLAMFEAIPQNISKRFSILLDFGTAALFFYAVHMFVVFALGVLMVSLFGYEVGRSSPMNPDSTKGIESLWGYFSTWTLALLLLWPMTKWYSRFKSSKPADSIWRFF